MFSCDGDVDKQNKTQEPRLLVRPACILLNERVRGYTYPVMVSQARQVRDYFSHFHLGHDGRHVSPQVAFVQLLAGQSHL